MVPLTEERFIEIIDERKKRYEIEDSSGFFLWSMCMFLYVVGLTGAYLIGKYGWI